MANGRIYTDYDPVRISWGKDLDKVALKAGLVGNFEPITDSDLPANRDDRASWEFKAGKVKVNASKKAAKDAEKQAKKNKKAATLAKLGITEDELKDLM